MDLGYLKQENDIYNLEAVLSDAVLNSGIESPVLKRTVSIPLSKDKNKLFSFLRLPLTIKDDIPTKKFVNHVRNLFESSQGLEWLEDLEEKMDMVFRVYSEGTKVGTLVYFGSDGLTKFRSKTQCLQPETEDEKCLAGCLEEYLGPLFERAEEVPVLGIERQSRALAYF
jgi:hypothetical protein